MKTITIAMLMLCNLLVAQARSTKSEHARELVYQWDQLTVGNTHFRDAQRIATAIDAIPSAVCTRVSCSWTARIDSIAESDEPSDSRNALSVTFSVKNSLVVSKEVQFRARGGIDSPFVSVAEQMHWKGNTTEPLFIARQSSDNEPYYRVFIRTTPSVDPLVRKRYESFDFHCLDTKEGCSNAKQILPSLDWP